MSEPAHIEVRITCASDAEASLIAGALVDEHLAACTHRARVTSVYEWRGVVEHDDEILVTAVTRADVLDAIVARVGELHSYELPAITAVALTGSPAYLAWVDERTRPPI